MKMRFKIVQSVFAGTTESSVYSYIRKIDHSIQKDILDEIEENEVKS